MNSEFYHIWIFKKKNLSIVLSVYIEKFQPMLFIRIKIGPFFLKKIKMGDVSQASLQIRKTKDEQIRDQNQNTKFYGIH